MNHLIRTRQCYPDLAQSDKKLADYLLAQPDVARHLSPQQLASETSVSQSSVVKLAQKMDFKGFLALKLAINEILASNPNPHSTPVRNQAHSDDPIRVMDEKLTKENVAAMHTILGASGEEELMKSVMILRSTRRIIVTEIGVLGLMVQNFTWRLLKIDFNTVVERGMHALLVTVQALSSSDLLLAISYTGKHRKLNLAVDETLRTGTKILAVTGFTPSALQQRISHCLYAIAEEQTVHNTVIFPTHAQMMFTDLLSMVLVWQDLGHVPERIRRNEALVKELV